MSVMMLAIFIILGITLIATAIGTTSDGEAGCVIGLIGLFLVAIPTIWIVCACQLPDRWEKSYKEVPVVVKDGSVLAVLKDDKDSVEYKNLNTYFQKNLSGDIKVISRKRVYGPYRGLYFPQDIRYEIVE